LRAVGLVAFAFVAVERAFDVAGLAADAFVAGRAGFAGAASVDTSASRAAAASARAVLLRAARALPAAVWAPFALVDFPAAIRALAAFAAAALPVCLVTRPPVATVMPPSAALTFTVSRDLRRAAAFGWMAPAFAARSSAESASRRAVVVASGSAVASRISGRGVNHIEQLG